MDNSGDALQRTRERSVQASNDTLTNKDRSYIQSEMKGLGGQLDYNSDNTQFNHTYKDTDSLDNSRTQTDADADDSFALPIGNFSKAALGIRENVSIQSSDSGNIENSINSPSSIYSVADAAENSLECSTHDADIAKEVNLFNQYGTQLYANVAAVLDGKGKQPSTFILIG